MKETHYIDDPVPITLRESTKDIVDYSYTV